MKSSRLPPPRGEKYYRMAVHQKVFSENTTIFGFDKSLYSGGVFVESLAHTFYGGRGPWIDKLDFWCYENLINQKNKKVKNISSSITNIDFNYGSTCTYPQRKKIFDNLDEFNFIDNYGDSRISPERKNSLIDYKFNIFLILIKLIILHFFP